MIHQKAKMMGKIGVDRSEELKITQEENDFENWNSKKNWKKSKIVEQRKLMNSQAIREISPESNSMVYGG